MRARFTKKLPALRALASAFVASSLVMVGATAAAQTPDTATQPQDTTPSTTPMAPVEPNPPSPPAAPTEPAGKYAPPPAEPAGAAEPFAFADFSWAPGNYGSSDRPLKWGPFTGEIRLDTVYHYSFNHPSDNTISGSSEVFRHNEVQVTQIGFGGDFLYKNVQARLMTQFGLYSTAAPRNDASPGRGQWNLDNAYRYISEAYGGYHIDVMNGIDIQAGIFMSYVGLWSYYNFDNWTYQPSYVFEHAVVLQRHTRADLPE